MDTLKELYRLMDELASNPSTDSKTLILDRVESLTIVEQDVSTIIDYARQPPPNASRTMAALEILDRIGFPRNTIGLALIVSIASDPNSPNWEVAQGILMRLGINAIGEIRNALRIYSQDCDENGLYIQGLCQLLENLDPSISKHTIPELLLLVEKGTDNNFVDEYALWPLKKIGSPAADAVIPKLISKILAKDRSVRIKKKCAGALKYFDRNKIKPYMEDLQKVTQASEDLIGSVENLLSWINNKNSNRSSIS